MKRLKKVLLFFVLIIGVFSFTTPERDSNKLNLDSIDVNELLSMEASRCRPSSEFMFYVDTETLKKSRGYSTIKADIFIYERATGKFNLLSNNSIIVPNHKEAILDYEIRMHHFDKTLENGDKVLDNKTVSTYNFNELIEHKTIYHSYLISRSKLSKNSLDD